MNEAAKEPLDFSQEKAHAKPARKRRSRAQIEEVWIVYQAGEFIENGFAFMDQDAAQAVYDTACKFGDKEAMRLSRVPVWKS